MFAYAPIRSPFSHLHLLSAYCPMSSWVCPWKPFWIPVDDSFKKAFVEEWVFINDVPCERPNSAEDPVVHNSEHSEFILVTPKTSKHSSTLSWETAMPQDFRSEFRHHCLRCGHGLNATSSIHVNSVPCLNVWYSRF